jgi:hypothetical protein
LYSMISSCSDQEKIRQKTIRNRMNEMSIGNRRCISGLKRLLHYANQPLGYFRADIS